MSNINHNVKVSNFNIKNAATTRNNKEPTPQRYSIIENQLDLENYQTQNNYQSNRNYKQNDPSVLRPNFFNQGAAAQFQAKGKTVDNAGGNMNRSTLMAAQNVTVDTDISYMKN